MLSRSIHPGCPFSPMLYILALKPFLCKLKANPALHGIILLSATTAARYSTYADNVAGAKINHNNKSVGLQLGAWKGVFLLEYFTLTDRPSLDALHLVQLNFQLEKKWLEVWKKAKATVHLWSQRKLSLKERVEICTSHIYLILLYQFLILPPQCTKLVKLVQVLFHFLWG